MVRREDVMTYHDGDVVQDGGKATEVLRRGPRRVVPGVQRAGGSQEQSLALVGGAQLLQEQEEVGRVIRADGVAANALTVRVFVAGREEGAAPSVSRLRSETSASEAELLQKVLTRSRARPGYTS